MVLRMYRIKCALSIVLLLAVAIVGTIGSNARSKGEIGVRIVRLMYDFNDVNDLAENYAIIRGLVAPSDWDRLNIDNEMRTVNTYFKFKAAPSHVNVVYSRPGIVVYTLTNDNIDGDVHWVFEYDVKDNKVCNIREYRMKSLLNGAGGVI